MRRTNDLEQRLAEWGKEYCGGRYDDKGWSGISPLAQLMKYHGRPPQGLNPGRIEIDGPADKVELAVRALEKQARGNVPAMVLRCEYFATTYSRDEKLHRLRRVGQRMDTSRYSHHLRLAKVHVAAWLHLDFDEPLETEQQIGVLEYLAET